MMRKCSFNSLNSYSVVFSYVNLSASLKRQSAVECIETQVNKINERNDNCL